MATGVRIRGAERTERLLRQVRSLYQRPEPLLKAWGTEVLKWIDRTFEVGGRPRWKALRPSTVAARRQGRGSGSTKPLLDEGSLRRSFDWRLIGAKSVEIVSDSPIAKFHQFGTRGPYEIRPKTAKALFIPTGPRTFSAVHARSRFRRGGGATGVVEPGGRRRQAFRSGIFRKKVIHPGLPARRMTPTRQQLRPLLDKTAAAVIRLQKGRGGA